MKLNIALMLLAMTSTLNVQANISHLQQAETKFIISSYAKTQYPIVFAHPLLGFNRLATENLGMDYWYQILPDLARNGSTAFAIRMSPFKRITWRAMCGSTSESPSHYRYEKTQFNWA